MLDKYLKNANTFYWNHLAPELQRANHIYEQASRRHLEQIGAAKKAGDIEKADKLEEEWAADADGERADFDVAETAYFLKIAAKYHIRVPREKEGEYWERCDYNHQYILTTAGIDLVENKMYDKRKKRWEFWIAVAPLTIGVLGAIASVATVLQHC
jgi:hypothetical protein